jgi:LysM repeat protein/ribosomal protein L40E
MSPENTSQQKTKICPTCGTRLSENATRCLVCGTDLGAKPEPKAAKKAEQAVQASRMPEITLSLPIAVGLLVLLLAIGAVVVFFALKTTGVVVPPTEVPSPTSSPTASATATETLIPSPIPTVTVQPPFDYTVKAGDTCGGIAFAFGVSTQAIIVLNNLSSQCTDLVVGQSLKIPFPTATPAPLPTTTPLPATQTMLACERVNVTVQENDTLSSIALNYGVSMQAIKDYNGLSTDNVFVGQTLTIPLCARAATAGPSPTATIPPPYPAPNLLLPADGAAFTLANDVVTLQWASVGTLREGEAYQIVIEDVTSNQGARITDYVSDTKYIVPTSFRPKDNVAHVMRWWIVPVRQTGTDDQGQPIYTPSGAVSEKRVFTWVGVVVEGTPSQ